MAGKVPPEKQQAIALDLKYAIRHHLSIGPKVIAAKNGVTLGTVRHVQRVYKLHLFRPRTPPSNPNKDK